MTLATGITLYLAHVQAHSAEGTHEAYSQRLARFVAFAGRRRVNRRLVNDWCQAMQVEGLHPRTIALHRRCLRGFYAWLLDNELVASNPVGKFNVVCPASTPKEVFTDDEYLRLLEVAADTDFWDYGIRMGYDTGLRLSDVAEMRWSSVSFETQSVRCMPRKTKRFQKVIEVPLCESTMHCLACMKLKAGASPFVAPWMSAQYQADSHRTLSMQFIRLARKAGVEGKSYHHFRSSFITRMLAHNVNPALIAAMTGHALNQIMAYAKPSLETKREAMGYAKVVGL